MQEPELDYMTGDIIIYRTSSGTASIKIMHKGATLWMHQRQLAQLFGVELPTISEHLKSIYGTGELDEIVTLRKIRRVQKEGNRDVAREIVYYNLDAVPGVSGAVTEYGAALTVR